MSAYKLLVLAAVLGLTGTAQQKPATRKLGQARFAVVSIRAQPPGYFAPAGKGPVFPGGKYINQHAALWSLITFAYPQYSFPGKTLVGLPKWAFGSTLFAVEAKPAPGAVPSLAEMRKMMATALVDRFDFKYHVAKQRMPCLFLEVAKGGPHHVKRSAPGKPALQLSVSPSGIVGRGATMDELASHLVLRLVRGGKPVVNRTGLTGFYDIDGPAASGGMGRMQNEDTTTRLLRAIGLKLVSGNATVPVMIVDHVSMPTPN